MSDPPPGLRVRARAGQDARCVYCRDDLPYEDAWGCPECGVQVHYECMRELDCCPSPGCGGRLADFRWTQAKDREGALRAAPDDSKSVLLVACVASAVLGAVLTWVARGGTPGFSLLKLLPGAVLCALIPVAIWGAVALVTAFRRASEEHPALPYAVGAACGLLVGIFLGPIPGAVAMGLVLWTALGNDHQRS